MPMRYVIKVKSSTKIPDFVQIRDEHFILLGYLRLDRSLGQLSTYGIQKTQEFTEFLDKLPFGKVGKYTPSEASSLGQ